MTDRRTVGWIIALVAAAAITQLLVWWLRPPPQESAIVGPPRSSYDLDNFTMYAFGNDGALAFSMTAPHLARREGNDSLYVNAPRYYFAGSDGSDWHGTSQYAWISAGNELVKLIGTIAMHRTQTADILPADITTADATVWTQQKRLATAAPSTIQQPGSILRGVGMRADFDNHSLELLSDVHGTFTPSRKKN